jgi:HEAT repeat protein
MAGYTKATATKFIASTVLGVMTFPLFSNTQILAQTVSTQSKCTDIYIQNQINQLDKTDSNRFAYDALTACKDKAIPELIKALKNQNKQVRIMAITALAEIASPDAVLPLSDLLSNETAWDVRASVIFALSKFGKQGVPTLITALKDKDWYIRYQTANALSEIGFDAKNAVLALNDAAVKDENLNVRHAAKTALVEIEKKELFIARVGVEKSVTFRVESAINRQNEIRVKPCIDCVESSGTMRVRSAINTENMATISGTMRVGTAINTENTATSRVESAINQPTPGVQGVPSHANRKTVGEKSVIQRKSPLMCRVPVLHTIFKWKCSP